jgi:hypothetical protein
VKKQEAYQMADQAFDAGYEEGFAAARFAGHECDKWQEVTVDPKGAGHTYRLRVPGGWLYRTTTYRFPENHAQFEAGHTSQRVNEDYNARRITRDQAVDMLRAAQEIATMQQTFVPEA